MRELIRYSGQGLVLAILVAFVGFFAAAPAYEHFPPDQAMLKITFVHGGQHVGGCRELSAEELEELAPNMRRARECPRDRLPVVFEVDIDGETMHSDSIAPSGLHGDGPAVYYDGFPVEAGVHTIAVRLRDSDREEGFDYEATRRLALAPSELLVIQFRPEGGGFVFTGGSAQ